MFTEQLMNVSSNLTFAGDILQVGELLFGSVELLTRNPTQYQQSSYRVGLSTLNLRWLAVALMNSPIDTQ